MGLIRLGFANGIFSQERFVKVRFVKDRFVKDRFRFVMIGSGC